MGLHYYAGTTGRRQRLKYSTDEWYEFTRPLGSNGVSDEQHWAVMSENDPQHRVKLIVGRWGSVAFADPSLPADICRLSRRAAGRADFGTTLDTSMPMRQGCDGNVAQNSSHIHRSLLLTKTSSSRLRTSMFFEMYAAHQNGQSVRTYFRRQGSATNGRSQTTRRRCGRLNRRRFALGAPGICLREWKAVDSDRRESARRPKRREETEIVGAVRSSNRGQSTTLSSTDIHASQTASRTRTDYEPRKRGDESGQRASHLSMFCAGVRTRLQMALA